jgi:hypothetical protein
MRDINVDIQSFCFEDVNLSDEVHLIIIHCKHPFWKTIYINIHVYYIYIGGFKEMACTCCACCPIPFTSVFINKMCLKQIKNIPTWNSATKLIQQWNKLIKNCIVNLKMNEWLADFLIF